ncbi:MAG TPA: hypothetical protein VG963_17680 [Polyangiaceae bacterium]|nr:hypothetical protein [Polyangiaceae bacterium]
MSAARPRTRVRRLSSPLLAIGLGAGTTVAFALLAPLAAQREQQAESARPDLVSLTYLRLGLEQHPEDRDLRLRLAERSLAGGLFEAAEQSAEPLARAGDLRARLLGVEIDFQRWMAMSSADPSGREHWLGRTRTALDALSGATLDAPAVQRLAQICTAIGELSRGARFLDQEARRQLDEASVQRADAAHLAAGEPLAAARLWATLAEASVGERGPEYASLALDRALAADRAPDALALFEDLAPRFGATSKLLELGLAAASGVDDSVALQIARQLLAMHPGDGALEARVAQLETWAEPAPSSPKALDRSTRIARARANWDLPRVLALTDPEPQRVDAVVERVSLLEATGQVSEALSTLQRALATPLASEPELWGRRLALELAAGQIDASLSTFQAIDRRFGLRREDAFREADLLLSLGRTHEAMAVLAGVPLDSRDPEPARRLVRVAWETGDLERARPALEVLAASPGAESGDFARLSLLEYRSGRHHAALAAARQGYHRFGTAELLQLSLDAALAAGDREATLELLAQAQADGSELLQKPAYWSLRAQLYQERAERALSSGELASAQRDSARARELLLQGTRVALPGDASYGALWQAQHRQALELALASHDDQALAVAYQETAPSLSPRERVQVLSRLGADEQAAEIAVDQASAAVPDSPDQDGLDADARSLTAALPRQVWAHTGVQQLPQLFSSSLGGGTEYAFARELRLGAVVDLTRFSSSNGELAGGSQLPWANDGDAALEIAAQVTGRIADTHLAVGFAARPDSELLPFASVEQHLLDSEHVHLSINAGANERSSETARLRLFGAEDRLALSGDVGLGDHVYASASVAGQLYWDRDRTYLGSGATINAGVGYNMPLGDLAVTNVRAATYVAPRMAVDASAGFVPEGTTWVGVGGSITRGHLDLAPVLGHELAFLSDATLGWLMPQHELGWSGRLGLGLSLFGSDLLSLSASASNVLGTAPGFAAYALNAEYHVSLWK